MLENGWLNSSEKVNPCDGCEIPQKFSDLSEDYAMLEKEFDDVFTFGHQQACIMAEEKKRLEIIEEENKRLETSVDILLSIITPEQDSEYHRQLKEKEEVDV